MHNANLEKRGFFGCLENQTAEKRTFGKKHALLLS